MWVQREQCGAGTSRGFLPWRCRAVAWLCLAVLLGAGFAGSASAMRIDFPDDVVLSDPASASRLTVNSGYTFQIQGAVPDLGWTNSAGDKITVTATASFAEADSVLAEFMVVFTSIRVGVVNSITCAELSPGGVLPLGPFSYVDNSFGGAVTRQLDPTDSEIAGQSQVCNAEDASSPFFGLVLAPDDSGSLEFSFKIETTEDDVPGELFQQMRMLKQGYMAVPEPATALLVLGGLVILTTRRRAGSS